jgi:hypothetical protein
MNNNGTIDVLKDRLATGFLKVIGVHCGNQTWLRGVFIERPPER